MHPNQYHSKVVGPCPAAKCTAKCTLQQQVGSCSTQLKVWGGAAQRRPRSLQGAASWQTEVILVAGNVLSRTSCCMACLLQVACLPRCSVLAASARGACMQLAPSVGLTGSSATRLQTWQAATRWCCPTMWRPCSLQPSQSSLWRKGMCTRWALWKLEQAGPAHNEPRCQSPMLRGLHHTDCVL